MKNPTGLLSLKQKAVEDEDRISGEPGNVDQSVQLVHGLDGRHQKNAPTESALHRKMRDSGLGVKYITVFDFEISLAIFSDRRVLPPLRKVQ